MGIALLTRKNAGMMEKQHESSLLHFHHQPLPFCVHSQSICGVVGISFQLFPFLPIWLLNSHFFLSLAYLYTLARELYPSLIP